MNGRVPPASWMTVVNDLLATRSIGPLRGLEREVGNERDAWAQDEILVGVEGLDRRVDVARARLDEVGHHGIGGRDHPGGRVNVVARQSSRSRTSTRVEGTD